MELGFSHFDGVMALIGNCLWRQASDHCEEKGVAGDNCDDNNWTQNENHQYDAKYIPHFLP